ncbi:hypothetical protein ACMFY5_26295 [Pseudomonas sihuiensis]
MKHAINVEKKNQKGLAQLVAGKARLSHEKPRVAEMAEKATR